MGQTLRSVWKLLALAGLLATLLAIPAIGQDGLPSDPDTIRLHLGTDGQYFLHTDSEGNQTQQNIAEPSGPKCELGDTVDGPVASLSADNRGPGLNQLSIGVFSRGEGRGVPCGRVDSDEELTLTLGDGFIAESAAFDLELKGHVEIEIRLSNGETFIVRSGNRIVPGEGVDSSGEVPFTVALTSSEPIGNCQGQSDSGPDAGPRDNCYVTVEPSSVFNEVTFAPTAGEMSLEGSGDYDNDPDFDTIFYLSAFDGELDCGDEVTHVDGDVTGTIIRHDNWDGSICVLKPYSLVANADDPDSPTGQSVTFDLAPDGQNATYTAFLSFSGGALTTPTQQLTLNWSTEPPFPAESFTEMLACEEDPFDAGGAPNLSALPAGEEGCIISVFQDFTGEVTWHVFFLADPKFY